MVFPSFRRTVICGNSCQRENEALRLPSDSADVTFLVIHCTFLFIQISSIAANLPDKVI